MTEQELKKIMGDNIPFEELEKTGEVFEIFKQGDMSLNIQWKAWETSDGKDEAFLFHICKNGEQIPIGGKYWFHPDGYLYDRSAPMTDVVYVDIADAWNRCCACNRSHYKGDAWLHIPDDALPY